MVITVSSNEYMRMFKVIFPAVVLAVLGGCSNTVSQERLGHLINSDIGLEFSQYTAESSSLVAPSNIDDVLAKAEGKSSSLGEIMMLTMEHNTDIQRAATAVSRANAERLNSVFGYLPQISGTINRAKVNQEVISSDNAVFSLGKARFNTKDYSVNLVQPVFDLSRIYSIKISKTLVAASEVDYIATVKQAMFSTFDTYLAALQSIEKIASLKKRIHVLNKKTVRELDRSGAGLSSVASIEAVKIELADLDVELADEQVVLAKYYADLSTLTGTRITHVAKLKVSGNLIYRPRITSAQAVDKALRNNPEILRKMISVAETDLRKQQAYSADFAPVLSLFSDFINEDREGSRFGGGSQNEDLTVGLRVRVPIFNAKGNGYESSIATIDFQDAKQQYLAQKRKISTDVIATYKRVNYLYEALVRARASRTAAQKLVRAERARVKAGRSHQILAMVVELRSLRALERLRFYKLEFMRARGRLEFLTGFNMAKQAGL